MSNKTVHTDENLNSVIPEKSVSPSGESLNSEAAHEEDFYHPVDIAEHLENLPFDQQLEVVRKLPAEDAAEALAELDNEQAGDLLTTLAPHEAANIVAEMSLDDAADVLDELEAEHRDKLLEQMPKEDAEDIRDLMAFDPETAGGIMNPDIIMLQGDFTTDRAIQNVRENLDTEIPYYIYVIDEDYKLIGVQSLRDLLLSRPHATLRESIGNQDVISVRYDEDSEEVARKMSHYNFAAMPVVDYEDRMLGIVTYDDVMDIIQDAASEDMLGMVGAGPDETEDTPWQDSVKMRLPWLAVNLLTSAASAFVVYLFEGSIATMAMLAVLMPMVANQAGNAGHQALAVMIRQLAVESFDQSTAKSALLREGKIGLATGLAMGIVAMAGVYILEEDPVLGAVMGAALVCDVLLGVVAGCAIPLFFRRIGRDPAQASSIFLSSITDCAGFFIFLGLATVFLL